MIAVGGRPCSLIVGGGTAYAAYRYDAANADRVLMGVRVAGVDVGGMSREEAVRTIRERAERHAVQEPRRARGGRQLDRHPGRARHDARTSRRRSTTRSRVADEMSFLSRIYHRLRDIPVDESLRLPFTADPGAVEAFVQQAFDEVAAPAVDARFELVDGELVTRRSARGSGARDRARRRGGSCARSRGGRTRSRSRSRPSSPR